jgi:hypothetical protein
MGHVDCAVPVGDGLLVLGHYLENLNMRPSALEGLSLFLSLETGARIGIASAGR